MRRLIGVLLLALAIPVVGRAEPNISGVWRLSRPPRAPAEATPPILQTPGRITMIVEFLSQVRRIDLTRRSHAPPETLSEGFYGDSVGHWEGDVLVVDTVGLKGRVLLFNDAPHSDALRIVERIRLVTPDILADEVTITDPKVLTGPWIVTRVFARQPDLMIGEFVCEDNNPYYRDTDGRLALHRRPAGN
jgi:hypothetical protein